MIWLDFHSAWPAAPVCVRLAIVESDSGSQCVPYALHHPLGILLVVLGSIALLKRDQLARCSSSGAHRPYNNPTLACLVAGLHSVRLLESGCWRATAREWSLESGLLLMTQKCPLFYGIFAMNKTNKKSGSSLFEFTFCL